MSLKNWLLGQPHEDEDIIEAHEYVQSVISDADKVREVEILTGKNLRDQLSIAELERIEEEVRLAKLGPRRN